MISDTMKNISQWLISILLGIIGWLLIMTWGSLSTKLTELQHQVFELQIQVTQLQSSQMTDARVNELIELRLSKQQK